MLTRLNVLTPVGPYWHSPNDIIEMIKNAHIRAHLPDRFICTASNDDQPQAPEY